MPEFRTETFRDAQGKPIVGDITYILDNFLNEENFYHWHPSVYQDNTKLSQEAAKAITDGGLPILVAKKKSNSYSLLSESHRPEKSVFDVQDRTIFISLDRLPHNYYPVEGPEAGYEGGLERSDSFEAEYLDLQKKFNNFLFSFGYKTAQFLKSPNPMNAAKMTVFESEGSFMKGLLRRAIQNMGVWNRDFEHLDYSNGVVGKFSKSFDYTPFIKVVKYFGGWVDFLPGKGMPCNFTIKGKTQDRKVMAIVQKAVKPYYPNTSQKKFAEAVYEAFGVSS